MQYMLCLVWNHLSVALLLTDSPVRVSGCLAILFLLWGFKLTVRCTVCPFQDMGAATIDSDNDFVPPSDSYISLGPFARSSSKVN